MEQSKTHFNPWIGPQFGLGQLGSKRLLVLGEAHYSDRPEDDFEDLTKDMISEIRAGSRSIPYFTKVQQLLVHQGLIPTDLRSVWDSIAFYNYIQGYAATTARVRPTAEMWESGRAPFAGVLSTWRPARVLVTGVELWNSLSTHFMPGWTSAKASADGQDHIFLWSSSDGLSVRATWIEHPSSYGYQGANWVGRVDTLME